MTMEVLGLDVSQFDAIDGIIATQASHAVLRGTVDVVNRSQIIDLLKLNENLLIDKTRRVEELTSKLHLFGWEQDEVVLLIDQIATAQSFLDRNSF